MEPMDYKPNSHKSKEERKVEKVANGRVRTKKKNNIRKFADVFISEDVANVKSYIFMDVLVPTIKKAIVDIVQDGVNMMVYGETGRGKNHTASTKVSYRSYYDDRRSDRFSAASRQQRGFDYDEIVFDSRGDAEAILVELDNMIARYGFATVSDLYDTAGLTAPYTANKYGWTNLRTAETVRVREGYILKMPKATPLD